MSGKPVMEGKGLLFKIYGGIDGTVYPRPRTFVLGVKVNL